MKIISCTATFLFAPIKGLLEQKDNLEKALKDEYPELTAVQVPDFLPPEIPRITAVSHHGFSNLSISTNSIQFTTRFDEKFNTSWTDKCKPYIQSHAESVFSIISPLFGVMLYCGLTINAADDIDGQSTDFIAEKHLKHPFISDKQLYDIEIKQAFEYEDKYYINLLLQNQRINPFQNNSLPIRLSSVEMKNRIGITIDINDRKAANYQQNYQSSKKEFDTIISLVDDIICNKMSKFITEGEFSI